MKFIEWLLSLFSRRKPVVTQKDIYEHAKSYEGTWEWADGSNPVIDKWFDLIGMREAGDEVPWCAAFVGGVMEELGVPSTKSALSKSYLDWGELVPLDLAEEGDIVVFDRGTEAWQGHVAFLVKKRGVRWEVLGGNQLDQVNRKSYSTRRIRGVRRLKNA